MFVCVYEGSGTSGNILKEIYVLRRTPNSLQDQALVLHHQNLIRHQEDEIFGVSTIDWNQTPWM